MRAQKWKELLDQTKGMKEAAMVSGILSDDEIREFHEIYGEVLAEYIRQDELYKMRMYVDTELIQEHKETMKSNPIQPGELPKEWVDRILPGLSFGTVVNNLESYSNRFTEKAAMVTSSLLEVTGMPLGGLAFLAFMGNYGITPFGVHKENLGEDGVLFHLGPGKKVFYTWKTERYIELSGGSFIYPATPEMMAEIENAFELNPGDAVFIPADVYHVADTPDFSISIVMDFINPPVKRLKQMLSERISKTLEHDDAEGYMTPLPRTPTERFLTEVGQKLNLDSEIEEALDTHSCILHSNQGYYTPSNTRLFPKTGIMAGTLSVQPPFEVISRPAEENKIKLYSRGHTNTYTYHSKMEEWLESFNGGTLQTVAGMEEMFAPEWGLQEVLSVLTWLQETGSLKVAESSERNAG